MESSARLVVLFERMDLDAQMHLLELAEKYAERWPALVLPALRLVASNPSK